jgi:hypothetical protein
MSESFVRPKLSPAEREALGPLGKQFQVNSQCEITPQLLDRLSRFLREPRPPGLARYRALCQAHEFLHLIAPYYRGLQPSLDFSEAALARVAEWAATELRKRGQDIEAA